MEYCGGGSLLEIVEIYEQFRLNERQVAYIAKEARGASSCALLAHMRLTP